MFKMFNNKSKIIRNNLMSKNMFNLKIAVYLMIGKIFCYIVKLKILQNHIHCIVLTIIIKV